MPEESPEDIKSERDQFRIALGEILDHPEEDAKGIAHAALLMAEMMAKKRNSQKDIPNG